MRQGQQPFSRHAGFFAALQRVEDRLASEQRQEQHKSPPPAAAARQSEPSPFSDTMTASPLLFLDPAPPPAPSSAADRDSSGPALDFLTEQDQQPIQQDDEDQDHDGGVEEDIARLMALLGLSPPTPTPTPDGGDGDGCDCSGADGFMAKVVGVVGPKCDGEKRRLGTWIRRYHRGEGEGGGCREPARLAHLLLARASCDTDAVAFPATVKEFLGRDPPQQLTDDESSE
ncbi:hypothetical protein BS78_06G133300 [Paspalum vaginatum]|nr:hypothetical protein BS78_06G133300 [Paspalum vaginatum]